MRDASCLGRVVRAQDGVPEVLHVLASTDGLLVRHVRVHLRRRRRSLLRHGHLTFSQAARTRQRCVRGAAQRAARDPARPRRAVAGGVRERARGAHRRRLQTGCCSHSGGSRSRAAHPRRARLQPTAPPRGCGCSRRRAVGARAQPPTAGQLQGSCTGFAPCAARRTSTSAALSAMARTLGSWVTHAHAQEGRRDGVGPGATARFFVFASEACQRDPRDSPTHHSNGWQQSSSLARRAGASRAMPAAARPYSAPHMAQ